MEVIDVPWAGALCGSGGTIRCWRCREEACQIATFTEQNPAVCTPRALLGTRAIRWVIDGSS